MSNEEVVYNSVVETASSDLSQNDKIDFQHFKIAANTFIKKVQDMFNKTKHAHLIIQKSTIRNGLKQFYQLMRESTNFTQQALQLQHNFEIELNKFLNRVIYLTWISQDGHLIYLDDAHVGELYSKATANRGRGNISASKMKDLIDVNDLTSQLQKKLKDSQNLRIHVYQTAVARWSGESNEENKNYDPSKNTFYWRLWDNHHISGWTAPIATRGVIAEGYAGAVINEDPSVVSSNLQFSLKNLYENHIQKDSIGGAIKGDIIWDQNGNIQFAVKEGSFSTARFGQYLNLAYNTIQIETITPQEYQNYLPKLIKVDKAASKILEEINKGSKEQLDDEIRKVAPLT